jgi:hypothetical protein
MQITLPIASNRQKQFEICRIWVTKAFQRCWGAFLLLGDYLFQYIFRIIPKSLIY